MRRRGIVVTALAAAVAVSGSGGGADAERSPSGGSSGVASETSTASPTGRWQDVEVHGIALRVPASWERLDVDDCGFPFARFGPAVSDPCDSEGPRVVLYPSALYDPVTGPGMLCRGRSAVGGYVSAGDRYAVYASTGSRAVTEQVLASARPAGAGQPGSGRWTTATRPGVAWRYPAWWDRADIDPRDASTRWSPGVSDGLSVEPFRRHGRWTGTRILDYRGVLLVHAGSEAIAQLILGSLRRAG